MAARHGQARDPLREAGIVRLMVLAPNWLGDAVMALPALADVVRASPGAAVTVAARASVAPLFGLMGGLAGVMTVDGRTHEGTAALRAAGFDGALLFPNSFRAAWSVARAGIRERWGYAGDWRRPLLTRAARRPRAVHQAAYYQHLTTGLGFAAGPLEPRLGVSETQRDAARRLLREAGWDGRTPLVALAPGAAYGGAKRWPAASFAAVGSALARDGLLSVLIGTAADAEAGRAVVGGLAPDVRALDLIGRTDLVQLAAVLAMSRGLVTNDSGAMHLAAALGVPVAAVFGPTNEKATHPIGPAPHVVLTHEVWCRPCMLRECPLRHRCMRGVTPDAVTSAARDLTRGGAPLAQALS